MSVTDFGLCTGHIVSFRSSRIRLLFFLSPLYTPPRLLPVIFYSRYTVDKAHFAILFGS